MEDRTLTPGELAALVGLSQGLSVSEIAKRQNLYPAGPSMAAWRQPGGFSVSRNGGSVLRLSCCAPKGQACWTLVCDSTRLAESSAV